MQLKVQGAIDHRFINPQVRNGTQLGYPKVLWKNFLCESDQIYGLMILKIWRLFCSLEYA